MRLVLRRHLNLITKIGNEKKISQEKIVIGAKMTEIESANASESVSENGNGSARERTARRAEAGAREEAGTTSAAAHLHPRAMRDVITPRPAAPGKIILSFIKLIHLANNGQKMPPKLKILSKMTSQAPQLLSLMPLIR